MEAHIFLCVLAYHLLISIEKTLVDQGVHTSWATVRETSRTHRVNTIMLPTGGGLVLRIRKGRQAGHRAGDHPATQKLNPGRGREIVTE